MICERGSYAPAVHARLQVLNQAPNLRLSVGSYSHTRHCINCQGGGEGESGLTQGFALRRRADPALGSSRPA
jgi:hypothetical protein